MNLDAAAWDDFVERARNGTLFHTQRFFGYHPEGRFAWDHAAIHDGGDLLALWPAASVDDGETWWSGAGASFGGPVVAGDDEGVSRGVALLLELARERGYRRVRATPPPPLYESDHSGIVRRCLLEAGFERVASDVFESVPLGAAEPASLLDAAARRGVGKAEREGVVVRLGDDYRALHALLVADRAEMGTVPVHSADELEDLAARFGPRQALLLAHHDGELVAGAWLLQVNDRVGLSFYVCQDRSKRSLRATNLVMLRALEWAAKRSLVELDLGTSSTGGELNPGLSRFKEAHGGKPHERETFLRELAE